MNDRENSTFDDSLLGFSIIIPVKSINDYILEAAGPIAKLEAVDFEVIILPNELPEKDYPSLKNPYTRIISTGRVSPAVKRDIGAKESKYSYLAFLDDDAYPDPNWLSTALKLFKSKNVAAVCGPAITPLSSSILEKASGLFYETFVGGGGMDYRYKSGSKDLFYVDDYPTVNLIVEKKAFFSVGGFDNNFWPGEDTKFCLDFTNKGHKILYSKDLIVWHHRRKVLIPHLKQIKNYGYHRGNFARYYPKTSSRLVYYGPSLFLGLNIIATVLLFNERYSSIILTLYLIYFFICGIDLFLRTTSVFLAILTLPVIYISHLTYGFMFLKGFLKTEPITSKLR